MSHTGRDGIRAERARRVAAVLGPEFRMRVTATAKLDEDIDRAREQREIIREAMRDMRSWLRGEGVELEVVVGQPRSPDSLRASLAELVNGDVVEEPAA